MSDEPDREAQGESEPAMGPSTRGLIMPGVPTPNRDRRREPAVIDLAAERHDPPPSDPDPAPPLRDTEGEATTEAAYGPEAGATAPGAAHRGRGSSAAFAMAILLLAAIALAGYAGFRAYTRVRDEATRSQQAIDALQSRLDALAEGARNTVSADSAAKLEQRVGALESGAGAGASLGSRVAAMEQRLGAVEAAAAMPPAVEKQLATLAGDLAGAKAQLAQLDGKIEAVRAADAKTMTAVAAAQADKTAPVVLPPPFDIGPLESRVGKLEISLAQIDATLSAGKNEARATEARAEVTPAASPVGTAAAELAVAQGLAGALADGVSYADYLAAAETLGARSEAVAALRPFAASGAPTAHALALRFAARAQAPAPAPASDQSLLGKLGSGAAGLIQVRRVGDAAASDVNPGTAAVAAALEHGDLDEALTRWAALPEAQRVATQDWADQAKARAAAAAAARAILADAMAALAKAKS